MTTRLALHAGLATVLMTAASEALAAPQSTRPAQVRQEHREARQDARLELSEARHDGPHERREGRNETRSQTHERLMKTEGEYRTTMAELRRIRTLMHRHKKAERAREIDELMAGLESRHELRCSDLSEGLSAAEKAAWRQRIERDGDRRRDQAGRAAEMERHTGKPMLRTNSEEDDRARRRIDAGNMDRTLDALRRRLTSDHAKFKRRHPRHRQALEQRMTERLERRRSHARGHDGHRDRRMGVRGGRDGDAARKRDAAHQQRDAARRSPAAQGQSLSPGDRTRQSQRHNAEGGHR